MRTLRHPSRRGFALLLTLIIVSFAAAIAVLFLLSARQERTGTDSYAQGSRVRQLADMAVNMVMGQINTATREGTAANPISWASQPGMIRTYNNTGALSNAYKLYSWGSMIESGTSSPTFNPLAASELPPNNWYQTPAGFTDLNAPVTVSNAGTAVSVYPIMDPTVANAVKGTAIAGATVQTASSVTWDFPNEVAYQTDGTGYTASSTNVLPMPVQWLYVLQDGTWISPGNGTGNTYTANGNTANFDGNVVTTSNPIVGRIAFWTDDETNKVNLNTAGEGQYWDWPKGGSADELALAADPPGRNEFWRIAGHPATTSLSAVFPDLMGGDPAFTRWNYSTGTYNLNFLVGFERILGAKNSSGTPAGVPSNAYGLGIPPRYTFGAAGNTPSPNVAGSQGGIYPAPYKQTYPPTFSTNTIGAFADTSSQAPYFSGSFYPTSQYTPITLNTARLYATPDELYFSPPDPTDAVLRGTETTSLNGMTPLTMSQRLFFITTDSRAPETTLFNTPRVSMWPVTWPYPSSYYTAIGSTGTITGRGTMPTYSSGMSPDGASPPNSLATLESYTASTGNHNIAPQEELLAFCSTLDAQGTTATTPAYPYYFQRQNPDSTDWDWSTITRNRQLANYVRGMVHQAVPGFGNSLESAWNDNDPALGTGTTADYITLECMDYCRSMIDQYTYDPSSASGNLLYSFTGIQAFQMKYPAAAGGSQSVNERMAQAAAPLRVAPAGASGISPNYFDGTPPDNAHFEGRTAAYVTQGSYPSLKEVSLVFLAEQRMAPAYLGPAAVNATSFPPITQAVLKNLYQDPFYWANLINVGSPSPSPPFQYGGATGLTPNSTSTLPDGIYSSTSNSNALEASNSYPVGAQTTAMRGIMLFDFAQLRDGDNAAPNPCFWIKVTGTNNWNIETGFGGGTGQPFSSSNTIEGEYIARTGYAAKDTVFQALKGKTFLPSSPPSTTNWPLCSQPIYCMPSDTKFNFNGGTIHVAIYAEYGSNGTTPDGSDPTNDAKQFVTSYTITGFADSSLQTQPIPIAPRWNVRQARSVPYPVASHQLAYLANATTTALTPVSPTTTCNWVDVEMVPDVRNITQYAWSTTPSASADRPDIRDINNGMHIVNDPEPGGADVGNTTSLDFPLGTAGSQWMIYATAYNNVAAVTNTNAATVLSGASTGTSEPPFSYPIISNGTVTGWAGAPSVTPISGWSMNMYNRVLASGVQDVTAEGTVMFTGTVANTNGGALYTNTTFNSGSQSSVVYPLEAFTEISPYDTVISAMVDPATSAQPATYANLQGDERLTNETGENLVFDSDNKVLATMNGGALYPAMVLNAYPPPYEGGSQGTSLGSTSAGFYAYPRATYQFQAHQLGNPSAQQFMTGYQLLPCWGTTSTLPNIIAAQSRANSTQNASLAMEGQYNGNLGSSQTYATWVGLDTNAYMELNLDWDWTSCPGFAMDGGYIDRPDQDYQSFFTAANEGIGAGTPYFSRYGGGTWSATGNASTTANFEPNRQVPSPVQFGTLPSSLTNGWQTLAFAPNQAAIMDGRTHPGVIPTARYNPTPTGAPYSGDMPDHLLLDLFWMPVAEPYPISEEFSTAGKVNLNYQMMPFPYIERKSGLDAVLKSVWIYAVPAPTSPTSGATVPQDYKAWYMMSPYATGTNAARSSSGGALITRYPVNVDETLKAFDAKFQAGDIFRSATQICDMFLYPNDRATPRTPYQGTTYNSSNSNITAFWKNYGMLTSDNGREAPYNAIYSRITTQSNTYMVHWRVQSLHKLTTNGSTPNVWTEGLDRVVSELRGSTLIERYIDPNSGATTANAIPDYANPSVWSWNTTSVGTNGPYPITYYYKWRIDNETYFQPSP